MRHPFQIAVQGGQLLRGEALFHLPVGLLCDADKVAAEAATLLRQPENTAPGVLLAGISGEKALLLQTAHDAVDGGGLHGHILLQLPLGDRLRLAVQVHQRPALDRSDAVLPQRAVHDHPHPVLALAQQPSQMIALTGTTQGKSLLSESLAG